jgi:hypothetical protein
MKDQTLQGPVEVSFEGTRLFVLVAIGLLLVFAVGDSHAQSPRDVSVEVGKTTTVRLRRAVNQNGVSVVTEPNNIARGRLDADLNRFRIEGLAEGTTKMTFTGTYRAIYVGRQLIERAVPFTEIINVRVLPGTRPVDSRTIPIQVSVGRHKDYAYSSLLGPEFRNTNEKGIRWRNVLLSKGNDSIAEGIDDDGQMKLRIRGIRNGRTQMTLRGERMNARVWQPVLRTLDVRVGTGRSNDAARDQVIDDLPGEVTTLTWNQRVPLGALSMRDYKGEPFRLTFRCLPKNDGPVSGSSVYGTDVYLISSPVCPAAVHAGVITPESGGVITLLISGGNDDDEFKGSSRNGVTTDSWKRNWGKFTFLR